MTFFSKPSWYGLPVLIRANTRPFLWLVAVILGVAVLASIITAVSFWSSPGQRLVVPFQVFVVTVTVIVFAMGWVASLFFWLRTVVNTIQALRRRSGSHVGWGFKLLDVPFYGWRAKDFSDEGLRYRRLAIEGVVGFVAINGLIWLLAFASKTVGVNLTAG